MFIVAGLLLVGVVLSLSLCSVCLRLHQHRRHQERISQRNAAVQAAGAADERVSGRVAATRAGPLGRAHDRQADSQLTMFPNKILPMNYQN